MTIAFIDHHLNNWHADTFLKLLRGPLADQGIEVCCAWESDPAGDDWCEKNQVHRAESLEDAVERAEGIIILAPDNIDTHLAFAERVLPAGKRTMIDKFLAPSLDEARAIVSLAESSGAPIFSSSSLRYAVEIQQRIEEIRANGQVMECWARGMGEWNGYGVHTLAMALRIMGPEVKRVIDTGTPAARSITLDYGFGRAVLDVRQASNQWESMNWQFAALSGENYVSAEIKDYDGFYANLIRRAAAFFKTGEADMTVDEALTTVAILEAVNRSGGEWIDLRQPG